MLLWEGSGTSRDGRNCSCTGRVLFRPIVSLLASMTAAYSKCTCRLVLSAPVYDATCTTRQAYWRWSLIQGANSEYTVYRGKRECAEESSPETHEASGEP